MKSLETLYSKIKNSERINSEEALNLLMHGELLDLADTANQIRKRLHPEPIVTYVVDRNINYTNVCSSGCLFCAF